MSVPGEPMHHQPQAALQQHLQRGATRHAWVLWRYWMLREFKTRYAGSVLGSEVKV